MKKRKTETVTFNVAENTIFDDKGHASRTMFLKPRETEELDRLLQKANFTEDAVHLWMTRHASAHHRRALKRLWKKGYQITIEKK